LVMAALATALYIPWAVYVAQEPGGYGLLLEHESQFVRPGMALAQAWAHFRAQLHLDGWLGRSAPALAALGVVAGLGRERRITSLARAGMVGALGFALGLTAFAGAAALTTAGRMGRSREAGARVTLAFFLVFSLLTPLYFPYPRLLIPWLIASVLLAGVAIHRFVAGPVVAASDPQSDPNGWTSRLWVTPVAIVAVGLTGLCTVLRPPWEAGHTYQPKDGFREAASQIAEAVGPGATVLVWAEPAVAFYLRSHGVPADPIADIRELRADQRDQPLYLVASLYAQRIPGAYGLERWRHAHPGQLEEVARAPVRAVSDVRLLDDFPLEEAAGFQQTGRPDYDLRLYVVSQR